MAAGRQISEIKYDSAEREMTRLGFVDKSSLSYIFLFAN